MLAGLIIFRFHQKRSIIDRRNCVSSYLAKLSCLS